MTVLLYAAIQTAIVGEGYKSYGEFSLDGQKYDLRAIFKEYGVKDDMDTNAKLQPGDLTPRRLQRFFRYQIRAYLEANDNVLPYLWKKYSTLDPRYRSITFPGAESLVETQDEGLYLLETYKTLDERQGTNVSERIKRVLLARRVLWSDRSVWVTKGMVFELFILLPW